jgi:hypothetical protein
VGEEEGERGSANDDVERVATAGPPLALIFFFSLFFSERRSF